MLIQAGGALLAHIQIVTDQEALIANKPLADRTVVHMLRSAADGNALGIP